MPVKDYKKKTYSYLYANHQYPRYKKSKNLIPKLKLLPIIIISLLILTTSYLIIQNQPKTLNTQPQKKLAHIKKPSKKQWKYIIIHHSGIDIGNAKRYHQYHISKYKQGLLYHFLIGNGKNNASKDGQIEIGFRWKKQLPGGHINISQNISNDNYNQYGIGICLVGNFQNHPPSQAQTQSLFILTQYLMKKFNIKPNNVLLHHQINSTQCPGKLFPKKLFFDFIQKITTHTLKFSLNLILPTKTLNNLSILAPLKDHAKILMLYPQFVSPFPV